MECWTSASKVPARILLCSHIVSDSEAQVHGSGASCPVCGMVAPTQALARCVPDYVPTDSLSWNAEYATTAKFQGKAYDLGTVTFEQLLARMVANQQSIDHGCQLLEPWQEAAGQSLSLYGGPPRRAAPCSRAPFLCPATASCCCLATVSTSLEHPSQVG
eukprot:jgi/Ulvmu1/6275/UM028_0135.1